MLGVYQVIDPKEASADILEAYLERRISKKEALQGIELMWRKARGGVDEYFLEALYHNVRERTLEWLREQYEMEYPGD